MEKANFGKTADGQIVETFTLANQHGLKAKLISYGALLTELHVPDRHGRSEDIVLGFDNLESYLKGHPHFGCATGRYANRIARGKFLLHGKEYQLACNNGPNHLHGGLQGIDKKVWKAAPGQSPKGEAVKFSYFSPDGEEGYPGNLQIEITYLLTGNDELQIDYAATCDRATPINLTNHSYFNLAGAGNGDILNHELRINAGFYTPVDDTSIPTGEILRVAGTVMDFTNPTPIGSRLGQLRSKPVGYDHNYVLNKPHPGELSLAAEVNESKSGRVMQVWTTEPGIQLYTANYLDGRITGKGGKVYRQHYAFCLECQHFPDSPNRPYFPPVILNPGQKYTQTTLHKFEAR
ncbi:MAG: galactose mutarotase [Verrucomicrobia bacterium]|nr:galactose mutarotase [Verrucomicrobiota bacterium]